MSDKRRKLKATLLGLGYLHYRAGGSHDVYEHTETKNRIPIPRGKAFDEQKLTAQALELAQPNDPTVWQAAKNLSKITGVDGAEIRKSASRDNYHFPKGYQFESKPVQGTDWLKYRCNKQTTLVFKATKATKATDKAKAKAPAPEPVTQDHGWLKLKELTKAYGLSTSGASKAASTGTLTKGYRVEKREAKEGDGGKRWRATYEGPKATVTPKTEDSQAETLALELMEENEKLKKEFQTLRNLLSSFVKVKDAEASLVEPLKALKDQRDVLAQQRNKAEAKVNTLTNTVKREAQKFSRVHGICERIEQLVDAPGATGSLETESTLEAAVEAAITSNTQPATNDPVRAAAIELVLDSIGDDKVRALAKALLHG